MSSLLFYPSWSLFWDNYPFIWVSLALYQKLYYSTYHNISFYFIFFSLPCSFVCFRGGDPVESIFVLPSPWTMFEPPSVSSKHLINCLALSLLQNMYLYDFFFFFAIWQCCESHFLKQKGKYWISKVDLISLLYFSEWHNEKGRCCFCLILLLLDWHIISRSYKTWLSCDADLCRGDDVVFRVNP